ncbi:hypothetical protein [Pseudomonas sp. 18175]|uniref:hypothetical protein n=1 Tax=Pseudomonas sp. 18175 TaxID=3390056 RepID=UPI003D1BE7EF
MNMIVNPQFSQGSVGQPTGSAGNQQKIQELKDGIKDLEGKIAAKGQQGSQGAQGGGEDDLLEKMLKMMKELKELMDAQGAGGGGDSAGGQGAGGPVQAIVEQTKTSIGF